MCAFPSTWVRPCRIWAGSAFPRWIICWSRSTTDTGLTGWGEGFGHTIIPATQTALESYVAPWFIGKDATDIEGLHRQAAQAFHIFGRNGPVVYAHSAIDIALWDIAGKRAGLPLYQLLGGARARTFAPTQALYATASPRRWGASAPIAFGQGFKHIKLHEHDTAAVIAARDGAGPDTALMNDVNCPWSVHDAIEMERAYRQSQPVLAGGTGLAAGGSLRPCAGAKPRLNPHRRRRERRRTPRLQGSLRKRRHRHRAAERHQDRRRHRDAQGRRVAEAHSVEFIPHCAYFGPGNLASIHVVAAHGPDTLLENIYANLEANPFGEAMQARNGMVAVPQSAGLGVEPDMAVVAKYRQGPVSSVA